MISGRIKRYGAQLLLLLLSAACVASQAQERVVASSEDLRARVREQPSTQVMLRTDVAAELTDVAAELLAQPAPGDTERTVLRSRRPVSDRTVAARVVQLTRELKLETDAQIKQQLVDLPAPGAAPVFESAQQALIAPSSDDDELTLIPVALVDRPLSYQQGRGSYVGRVAVGLVALGYSGPAKTLKAPITFQILGADAAAPEQQVVPSTSPPYPLMEIAANDPRDVVVVHILSNISTDPIQLVIPVVRAQLQINAADRSLQGWGLEGTVITVAASDGTRSAGQLVTLSKKDLAARGVIEPESQSLDANGQARFKLTSEAIGEVSVVASGPRFQASAPERFIMDPPLRFLGAAILGGIVGGVLRRGAKRRGKAKPVAIELGLAVFAGALVFGLFALGVNVTGFSLPQRGGELLVAVVAAVGGLFGTRLLVLGSYFPSRAVGRVS